jgi:ribosomal protein L35AE/L33A
MDPTGIIVNYHIAYTKEVLVEIPGVRSRKDAGKLVGKKATFTDPKGAKYIGFVSGLHGKNGILKIKFKRPLPPAALAKPINIAG